MKKRHTHYFRTNNYENPIDRTEFENYYELAENGLDDKEIARELDVPIAFAKRLKKESQEEEY